MEVVKLVEGENNTNENPNQPGAVKQLAVA